MNTALSRSTVPLDVRLMNRTSAALVVAAVIGSLAVAAWWLVRHPMFAVSRITVTGDTAHNSAATLRANVAPKLAGNFYTVDLALARAAFEGVPWVRRASVRVGMPRISASSSVETPRSARSCSKALRGSPWRKASRTCLKLLPALAEALRPKCRSTSSQ